MCLTAFPESSWSLCVWNPLIRGWGGRGGLGSSGENQLGASTQGQPGASAQGQAQPWSSHRQIFVVGLVTGPKQLAKGQGGVLEGDSTTGSSMGPGNNPGGDEISRALCAPRAGTGMEMGCSSPTSPQAACGARGRDWCGAGCHPGEVTSLAPGSPVPTVGGRRGLARVFKQLKSLQVCR